MPKLDIGVGDEFPAKEVKGAPREDDGPAVHHHHYYRGRYRDYRYRGRWLWFVLWILVVTAVFRLFDVMLGGAGWAWSQWGGPWGAWGPWVSEPFHALRGLLMTILIIGGWLVFLRCRPSYDRSSYDRPGDDRPRDDGRDL